MSEIKMTSRKYTAEFGPPISDTIGTQRALMPIRIVRELNPPNGADIVFIGYDNEGVLYYCKDDLSGRPARMLDAVFSQLAHRLGIAVPDWELIEDPRSTEFLFGSKCHISTAEDFHLSHLLRHGLVDDRGHRVEWLGRYFSALYALDLFLENWDRRPANMVLHQEGASRRLCAIDFAASNLASCTVEQFAIESSATLAIGRSMRSTHHFFLESAVEMVERIRQIPFSLFKGFVEAVPAHWINEGVRDALYELWAGQGIRIRLDALRAGLEDGSLL